MSEISVIEKESGNANLCKPCKDLQGKMRPCIFAEKGGRTMKIQYASDLHLEFAENRNYIENGGIEPEGDVLVLAGDVSYLGDRKMWKRPFWDWCAEHFRETYVVPGNHEFYGGFDIGRTMVDYELEVRSNVRYLNN